MAPTYNLFFYRKTVVISIVISMSLVGCTNNPINREVGFEDTPASFRSIYEKGKVYLAHNRFGLALKKFRMLEKVAPTDGRVLNALAVSYDKLGRFDVSKTYYEIALKLEPNSIQTINNLGYSFLLQGKFDIARVFFLEAKRIGPNPVVERNVALLTEEINRRSKSLQKNVSFYAKSRKEYVERGFQQNVRCGKKIYSYRINAISDKNTARCEKASARRFRLVRSGEGYIELVSEPNFRYNKARENIISEANQGHKNDGYVVEFYKRRKTQKESTSAAEAKRKNIPLIEKPTDQAIGVSNGKLISTIEIVNGTGALGMAARMGNYLNGRGVKVSWLSNAEDWEKKVSTIFYETGHKSAAIMLEKELPFEVNLVENDNSRAILYLELGADAIAFDRVLVRREQNQMRANSGES